METRKAALAGFGFLVACTLVAAGVAGGADPSCGGPPAAVCSGSKRIRVSWSAKRPSVASVSVSATQCAAPAACAAGGAAGLQTAAPVALTITDAACRTLVAVFAAPGQNFTGCPGGKDSYREATGKLRLIYGAATTLVSSAKVPLEEAGPPVLEPPLRFTLRDAAGYEIGGTTSTCFASDSGTVRRLKCF